MPALDDVLDRLHLRGTVFSRMTLAGEWGFAKDALAGAPFHLILSGQATIRLPDHDGVTMLEAGDIVVVPRGEPHHLLSDAQASPVPWKQMLERNGWEHWRPGMRFKATDIQYGAGEPVTRLISGVFSFDQERPHPLLAALPRVMLVRADSGSSASAALTAVAQILDVEMTARQAGAESIASKLAEILFVQVIRHQLTTGENLPQGWLRGMVDPEIGRSIALIHGEYEKTWSVETLAQSTGMSRSRFAARFKEVVGQSPVDYLTDWRMHQASIELLERSDSLPNIAASVGYRSSIAFGRVFSRWTGQSPAAYRRSRSSSSAQDDR